MPNGSFDFAYAHPFTELAHSQASPADVERLGQLRYHLDNNDYFAFLATVFGILEDGLNTQEAVEEKLAMVRVMRKDLIFLQQEYRIQPVPIEA
jgi:hypothetical protein